jgi:hypothetical protein
MKLTKNYILNGVHLKDKTTIYECKKLEECIIATGKCKDDHVFLVKNRDRAYCPRGSIIHDFVNNSVERVMFLDLETAYNEGIYYNHTTGTVGCLMNTALSVQEDEEMKKLVSKNKTRSPDGINIDTLLSYGDFDKIEEAILSKKCTITGHTFLLEIQKDGTLKSKKFEIIIIKDEEDIEDESKDIRIESGDINMEELAVRTNHAYLLKNIKDKEDNIVDVGYTISDDYLSSLMRKINTEVELADEEIRHKYTIEEILHVLKKKKEKFDSPNNTNRDLYKDDGKGNNIGLRTTGQIGIDLTTKTFYYDNMYNKSEVLMVLNKMPKETTPIISIKLLGESQPTEFVDY